MRISCRFLGVRIDPMTMENLNGLIKDTLRLNDRCIIANHNLHSIYLYHHDPKMREFYDKAAQYVQIDGMSLILLGNLLGYPLHRNERVTYVDWIVPLMSEASRQGWRIFYLGSKPGVAERGAQKLLSKFPELRINLDHGYFDIHPSGHENKAILLKINAFKPHILLVGMGMPKQEYWILDNLNHLNANIILTAGACIDYVAGELPTPPRWLGNHGLEWAFRLSTEPRRLWRRYLIEPWFVLGLFLKDLFRRTISKTERTEP